MSRCGYSFIETFGAIALVLTLAIIAVPNIRNFTEGGKQGAAARNASALNSAVAQYDQAGGLQMDVPPNMKLLAMNQGGHLQLYLLQGQYYMRATSTDDASIDLVYPATIDRGVVKWGLPNNTLTNYLFPSGGTYAGLTQVGNQYATGQPPPQKNHNMQIL